MARTQQTRSRRDKPLRVLPEAAPALAAPPPAVSLPPAPPAPLEVTPLPKPRRWGKATRGAMTAYVRHLADVLALRDWEIIMDWAPADPDNLAQIDPVFGQKRAVLRFGPEFLALSSSEQRQTVAHELIHCHLQAVTDQAKVAAEALGPPPAAAVAEAGLAHQVEVATDALADAFAPFLPLPPWRS